MWIIRCGDPWRGAAERGGRITSCMKCVIERRFLYHVSHNQGDEPHCTSLITYFLLLFTVCGHLGVHHVFSSLIHEWLHSYIEISFFILYSSLDRDADHLLLPVRGEVSASHTERGEIEYCSSPGRQTHSLLCELDKTTPTKPSTRQTHFWAIMTRTRPSWRAQLLLLSSLISSEKPKKKKINPKKQTLRAG